MKILLLTVFNLFAISVFSQTPKNNYDTKINTAQTVNIYGSGKTVIGKIVINQSIKSKILLSGNSQKKDSSGIYTTTFKFVNSESQGVPFFAVNITLKFSSPVISIFPNLIGETTSAFSMGFGFNKDSTAFNFKASQINSEGFLFIIQSKKKTVTEIYGVDGKVN